MKAVLSHLSAFILHPQSRRALTETVPSVADLPAFCRARALVLGVGNILFGDDGFGPEVVRRLIDHYRIPDDMYVMDVGTGARKILFTVTLSEVRPEEIVIVDAVVIDQAPHHFGPEAIVAKQDVAHAEHQGARAAEGGQISDIRGVLGQRSPRLRMKDEGRKT